MMDSAAGSQLVDGRMNTTSEIPQSELSQFSGVPLFVTHP
jgi:hypothetical protein